MSSPDRQYRRYRRTGDPQALAAVFDALAPELHRVAGHLLRDGAAADDAVQDTFLALIDDAARFDDTRAVAPWALGILVNRCRRVRRATRRPVQALDPTGPEPEDHHPQPTSVAESGEFTERLATMIRGIPQPYRATVELRLGEDLGPGAIAERLGRRPATVRSQLRRGLEHLRRGLPAGSAPAALAVGPDPVTALDEVRARVLRRAAERAPDWSPLPTGLHGGPLAARGLLFALAILLAAPLVWQLLAEDAPGRPQRTADVGRERGATTGPDRAAADTRAPTLRDRVTAPTPDPEPPPGHVRLVGRLVDSTAGGAPVAGAEIHVTSRATDDLAALYPDADAGLDERATSRGDGSFALHFAVPRIHQVELEIRATGRPSATAQWAAARCLPGFDPRQLLVPGRTRDLGDIDLPLGHTVAGVVRDELGHPVRGAHLILGARGSLARAPTLPGSTSSPAATERQTLWTAVSDRDGEVTFDGVWSAEESLPLALADTRFVAASTPRIRPADARPFDLRVAPRAPATTTARQTAPAGDDESTGSPHPPWTLRVVDARTGLPVESFAWNVGRDPRIAGVPGDHDDWHGARSRGTAQVPGGLLEVAGVPPGRRAVWIMPALADWQPSGAVRFTQDDAGSEFTVRLEPSRPLTVRIRTADDEPPTRGLWVEVLRLAPGDEPPLGLVAEAWQRGADDAPARIDGSFTSAAGTVTLQVPSMSQRFGLRITRPDGSGERLVVDAPGESLEVVLDAPSTARIALRDADRFAAWTPSLQATRVRGGPQEFTSLAPDGDGGFQVASLGGGTWVLRLVAMLEAHDGIPRPAVLEPPLGEVDLPWAPDAEETLLLPTAALHPAQVEGSVRVHGEVPPPGSRIALAARFPAGHPFATTSLPAWRVGAPLDAEGRFVASHVPAGQYVLELYPPDSQAPAEVDLMTRSVTAGAEHHWNVHLGGPRATLRIVDPDGQPCASRLLQVFLDGATLPDYLVTDEHGHARWQHHGPADLRIVDPESGASSAPERVDAERATEQTIRLAAPAASGR